MRDGGGDGGKRAAACDSKQELFRAAGSIRKGMKRLSAASIRTDGTDVCLEPAASLLPHKQRRKCRESASLLLIPLFSLSAGLSAHCLREQFTAQEEDNKGKCVLQNTNSSLRDTDWRSDARRVGTGVLPWG